MNAERRKRIEEVITKLDELRAELNMLSQEEQDAHDNLPESMQYGERGDKMDEAVQTIEGAENSLSDVQDELRTVLEPS